MIQSELVQLVNECVDSLLNSFSDIDDLYEILRKAAGRIESPAGSEAVYRQSWSLLPLAVGEAVSGNARKTIPVAAILHLFNAAAELFDDMEDQDHPDSALAVRNPAVAVNAATALVVAAQRMVTGFNRYGVTDRTAVEIIDLINGYYGTACSGQHLDLTLPPAARLSEETYFDILYRKSACTVECACHAGAVATGADHDLITPFRSFGKNLGIAAQIANDLQGVLDLRDIVNRQITLPVVFALENAAGDPARLIRTAFLDGNRAIEAHRLKTALYECGAMQYAMIKMELYKEQAREILQTLNDRGMNTESLNDFV